MRGRDAASLLKLSSTASHAKLLPQAAHLDADLWLVKGKSFCQMLRAHFSAGTTPGGARSRFAGHIVLGFHEAVSL